MAIKFIRILFCLYQGLTQSRNGSCRYIPTCSQYALEAIEKHGTVKGSYLAFKRLISCHPFSKRPYYDPA